MAFDSLTDKLQNVFRKLRSKGTITEADVKEAKKEGVDVSKYAVCLNKLI